MISLFTKALGDYRRSLIFWVVGIVLIAILMMLFYPSVKESASAIEEYMEAFPPELLSLFAGEIGDFTSPAGYLNTELFFMIVPLLFLIFAIGRGGGAVAGEEESGTLDLLLSYPLPRRQIVLAKFASVAAQITVLAAALWLSLIAGAALVDMEIGWTRLGAACLSAVLLGLAFGTLALAIGCAWGNRGLAVGAAGGLAVISYFINALSGVVSYIEPFRNFSLFYYYIGNDPLRNGLNAGHTAILIIVSLILLAVALLTFRRRDLSV